MINFIKKFVASLSDEELSFLRETVYDESNQRAAEKRKLFGANPPLTEDEKKMVLNSHRKIGAIRAYMDRTGHGLKEAKDTIEDFINLNKA